MAIGFYSHARRCLSGLFISWIASSFALAAEPEVLFPFGESAFEDHLPELIAQTPPSAPAVPPPAFAPIPSPGANSPGNLPNNFFPTPRQTAAAGLFSQFRGTPTRNLARPMLTAPNMFGDTTDGGCGQAEFLAGTVPASLEHPTFNCIRANLAENNSPLPRDRVYFRYNHFHNITDVSIFPDTLSNGVSSLHVDRFTFGGEMTFLDGRASLEARLPLARQLTSDVYLYDIQGAYNLPLEDYRTELLNMQFILKYILLERDNFVLSSGMGLNVPTAQDFNIRIFVDDDDFEIILPVVGQVGSLPVDIDIRGTVPNNVWNLSPFLAYLWTPQPRFFTQGFMQLDVPLNGVTGTVEGSTGIASAPIPFGPYSAELYQQTLMRFNVGAGYWLVQRPEARWFKGWASILELHYTTTLNDATIVPFDVPLVELPAPLPPVTLNAQVLIGNLSNRADILNLTAGWSFILGERTTLGVAGVVPLRDDADHPFDFELNVLLNYQL